MLPIRWMAPETIQYTCRKFSSASDIWAFGVTLWEIYTFGQRPYFELSNQEVLMQVPNEKLTLTPPTENCPPIVQKIMQDCWKFEPDHRISFDNIVKALEQNISQDFAANLSYDMFSLYETPIVNPIVKSSLKGPEGYIEVDMK